MSIDETIEKYRVISDEKSDCWEYCGKRLCRDCEKEHLQLTGWLVELKAYREYFKSHNMEDIEVIQNTMYNKAIYDFALALKNNFEDLPIIISKDSFLDFIDDNADLLIRGK